MGWNESSGKNDNDNGQDPWGKKNNDGPPDIDQLVRKMQEGLGEIFGKKSSGSDQGGGSGTPLLWIILGIACLWFAFDSFHIIDQQERGVVLRFGAHVADLQPGLNLRFPRPIEAVKKINVGQVRTITHKANMLTQDENIVDVEVAVQWKINDPAKFLFNVDRPATTLRQVTESAVREVIGKSKLDFVLTEGRNEIAERQEVLLQDVMDNYVSGVYISKVELQSSKPPEQVKSAFDDAIKAREDEQKLVNQAEAYRNDLIPRARGAAARLREESNSYKARVVAKAEGEASRFEQLLAEYQRAPEVTRQRLYLDTVEAVLASSSKVLIDVDNANSLMYLPLDKLLQQRSGSESDKVRQAREDLGRYMQSPNKQDSTDNTSINSGNRNRGVR